MTPAKTTAEKLVGDVLVVHQHELPLGAGDVVGQVEIGERLRVDPQTVAQWCIRAKALRRGRHPERAFPPARWTVSTFPAWYWPDVAAWAVATGRLDPSAAPPAP